MGGLLILTAALVPTLLWADLTNVYVWIAVLTTAGVRRDRLRRRLPEDRRAARTTACGRATRWAARSLIGDRRRRRAAGARSTQGVYNTRLIFPFFKRLIPDLGWCYLPFAVFVLVARSNAVNLTDGLDGLAISTFAIAAAALHRAGLRHRPPRVRRVPAARALSAGGGADDVLRRAGRRVASASSGTTRTRPRSSWATSARWRSAPRSAPSRS